MKKSGISRRRFIEYTGAAGLGIGLSPVLPQISLAKTGIKVASGAANPLGLAANTQAEGVFFCGGFGHLYRIRCRNFCRSPPRRQHVGGRNTESW